MHRYFNALEQVGYYDKRETLNLIIYLFIVNEVFEGRLNKHLDDNGLLQFEKVLKCLYKGCLINTVKGNIRIKEEEPYENNFRLRFSETSVLRHTQDDISRTPEIET